jgi:hypothetical protein
MSFTVRRRFTVRIGTRPMRTREAKPMDYKLELVLIPVLQEVGHQRA